MLVLQEYLLDEMNRNMPQRMANGQASLLADDDDLQRFVTNALAFLSEAFFTREWQRRQMDTSEGRRLFRQQIELAINNQSRNLGNMWLFRAAES
jgi:hypothetical protein